VGDHLPSRWRVTVKIPGELDPKSFVVDDDTPNDQKLADVVQELMAAGASLDDIKVEALPNVIN
jgi:hypothetical protein